ncbi:short-chain dehydrogenase [Rheinheimera sp. SA_1]|uniref:SDR family NAD(P)-dependent oxidoreductase n=1 Tax=Rheinheimera sp. SA_1 TaxID=1827365 RepID=UPI0007FD09FC|nr:SDR family NAD(P)-dependent oxidoreductase [Rheinheimera sp. SA_1]OBP15515.1 short-chain dehydrogenase [Rheinheimera sp. SA_1]
MQKCCLITGASSGLGRALALQYAAAGWQVLAIARSGERLQQLSQQSPWIQCLQLDLSDSAAVAASVPHISQLLPRLDLVILNAGTCEYVDAPDFELAAFDRTFAVNFFSVVAAVKYWLPLLVTSQRPQLAVVSSLAWLFPFTKAQAYGASKAALSYFTDSLRLDIADKGIQVSLIEPGFVDTPLTRKNDFAMPFMLPVEQAAARVMTAIDAGKLRYRFPKRLAFSLSLLNLLPYHLRQKVAAGMKSDQKNAAKGGLKID